MIDEVTRKPGRAPKNLAPKVEAEVEPKVNKVKMRAKPNWENINESESSVDRFKLPPEFLAKNDDMSFQWVTDSVLGQPEPQHRGEFEQKGWTPVHQEDFDGELNGMFLKRNDPNEINVGGQVLMARPKHLTERARKLERAAAFEQVNIKEQALRGGDLPTTLDSRHPSAIHSNRIVKTVERIEVPESRTIKE